MPNQSTTIDHVLKYLAPGTDAKDLCSWPPDTFAVAAFLLRKTGIYQMLVIEKYWVAQQSPTWVQEIDDLASAWRLTAPGIPPAQVHAWWRVLLRRRKLSLQDAYKDQELCSALLNLCAVADQTCVGVGVPLIDEDNDDRFAQDAYDLLGRRISRGQPERQPSSTLCLSVNPWVVSVLPKLHTPQTGMTLRSLTHHLSLCEVGEVSAQWAPIPANLAFDDSRHGLNLLLVPWPEEVSPLQFHPIDNDRCGCHPLAPGNGYFEFKALPGEPWPIERFKSLVREATRLTGCIDGVILPELSVPSEAVYASIRAALAEVNPEAFLVAGVGIAGTTSKKKTGGRTPNTEGENCVMYTVPLFPGFDISFKQNKHHRWRVEGSQIQQYGIGHRLDPSVAWWEHIDLSSRQLWFFSAAPWLTFCFLICEDLARQDPIADLLRAIGPNLVIALLMDGPQLKSRWPARYATVLADDPGSSVLTLTSIGMALQSRHSQQTPTEPPSRSIALWKDGQSATREIALDPDSRGVILTLARRYVNEFTADGRADGTSTAYLNLCDVIQVSIEELVRKVPTPRAAKTHPKLPKKRIK